MGTSAQPSERLGSYMVSTIWTADVPQRMARPIYVDGIAIMLRVLQVKSYGFFGTFVQELLGFAQGIICRTFLEEPLCSAQQVLTMAQYWLAVKRVEYSLSSELYDEVLH